MFECPQIQLPQPFRLPQKGDELTRGQLTPEGVQPVWFGAQAHGGAQGIELRLQPQLQLALLQSPIPVALVLAGTSGLGDRSFLKPVVATVDVPWAGIERGAGPVQHGLRALVL